METLRDCALLVLKVTPIVRKHSYVRLKTCHKVYKRRQPVRLTLPEWFDRQFSGAM
ncbi:MAG: hypothetical protein NW224_06725 [Leptolyngbyaceae cyanobacterium bins.302]|nr:hypothetical protein [Leptolyngbyaceae cyanobacterium bins.302]